MGAMRVTHSAGDKLVAVAGINPPAVSRIGEAPIVLTMRAVVRLIARRVRRGFDGFAHLGVYWNSQEIRRATLSEPTSFPASMRRTAAREIPIS